MLSAYYPLSLISYGSKKVRSDWFIDKLCDFPSIRPIYRSRFGTNFPSRIIRRISGQPGLPNDMTWTCELIGTEPKKVTRSKMQSPMRTTPFSWEPSICGSVALLTRIAKEADGPARYTMYSPEAFSGTVRFPCCWLLSMYL
jgi:hypothetical protein